MGYGLGASIGAKMGCGDMGHPDIPVFNIAGDGCFRMNMNEIATAARYNIPVIEMEHYEADDVDMLNWV